MCMYVLHRVVRLPRFERCWRRLVDDEMMFLVQPLCPVRRAGVAASA